MSAAVLPAPTPSAAVPAVPSLPPPPAVAPTPAIVQVQPRPMRWTCDLLQKVSDAGWLEGRNVFLVNGEVLEMPVPGPLHDMAVSLADYKLKEVFTPGHVVRVQTGLVFGIGTALVPDLAVVLGSPRDYKTHPRTAVLVVEVSDSSLAYDRGDKANLYAAAGVADYWVVDLVNRRLEVFRDPQPDPAVPFGAAYTRVTAHGPEEGVAPLAVPAAKVMVADLLP